MEHPILKKESSKSAKLSQSNERKRFDVEKATIESDTCKRRGRYGEYYSV
jgi:predicted nucleic-acid-binding Zn-ribbon protein